MAGAGDALLKLLSAWNEADGEARATILEEALAASSVYEDPNAPKPFEGPAGMAEYLDIFLARIPDAELHPMGRPAVTHSTAMVEARLDRDGMPFARLRFVGTMGEDGLARVTGFVEG
ncbi:hypothetical protein BCF33_2196 [Hasllibacter halocynthiae]|uniref:SnoaL-like protein n=1 Tax=Hasllibacter halocynthiae TaxID=595589 RepID=A0A2T0X301_9RHOB|nr:hypothetical protein [Hasllibacter halocynthiae]PRY93329.1 hypothetical protein BCF33_2196 [Hasllibacter halocynthiae]